MRLVLIRALRRRAFRLAGWLARWERRLEPEWTYPYSTIDADASREVLMYPFDEPIRNSETN